MHLCTTLFIRICSRCVCSAFCVNLSQGKISKAFFLFKQLTGWWKQWLNFANNLRCFYCDWPSKSTHENKENKEKIMFLCLTPPPLDLKTNTIKHLAVNIRSVTIPWIFFSKFRNPSWHILSVAFLRWKER